MAKKLILLLVLAFVGGCEKEEDCGCVPPESSALIAVKDTDGTYVEIPAAYPNFQVSYEFAPGQMDPNPPFFFTQENIPLVRIFLNNNLEEDYPTVYLRFSSADIDTLKSEFGSNNNVKKIWINGELQDLSSGIITIFK